MKARLITISTRVQSKVKSENPKLSYLSAYFGIDLRNLALLRIFLGVGIIANQVVQCLPLVANDPQLRAWHHGFLIEYLGLFNPWLQDLLSGETWLQWLLLLSSIVFAFFLVIGFHTRFFCFLSWLILLFPVGSNLIDLEVYFTLLLLLFWSFFLPLGAKFSVDEARLIKSSDSNGQVFSMASVILMLQVCFLPWIEWISIKNHGWQSTWHSYFSTELRYIDYGAFGPIRFSGELAYFWLLIAPCLLFSPVFKDQLRTLVIISMVLIQFFQGLSSPVVFLMFTSLFYWIIFLPSGLWNWAKTKLSNPSRKGLKIFYDGKCSFCEKLCLILRSLFLIRETLVTAASEDISILRDMEEKNSWVVVDFRERRFYEAEALVIVLSNSPILFPLGWIISAQPVLALMTRIYRFVARNRSKFSWLTRFVHFENR
mgnify:CR=1 FL=1